MSEPPVQFGVVPAHGVANLAVAAEQIAASREYGFDSVWIEEHHAQGPYWPTPFLAVAALAEHLGRLKIGTNVLVLPLHDPVHVAEQVAILDQMTSGRFVLGVGLGDSQAEFAAFQVPAERRGARFEDQVRIIRSLWRGDAADANGKFYRLNGVRLSTLPRQENGPPIWIGGWGPKQLRRAAELGDAWFPGPVGTMTQVVERQSAYDGILRQMGVDPLQRARPITRDVVIASTRTEAWEIASNAVLKSYSDTYLDSDHPLVGTSTSSRFNTVLELARDRMLVGDVDDVAMEAARYLARLHCSHLILRPKVPGIKVDQIFPMLRLLGSEVLPRLREAAANRELLVKLAQL